MTEAKSPFLRTIAERGYLHQCTDWDALDASLSEGIVVGYGGFDFTAPSLHVGNLVQIMMLRRLQQAGHKPIVLLGGATTKIGDPSFRDEARTMMDQATIDANKASIRTSFEKFINFGDGPTDAIMVDNDDWWSKLGYLEVLRDIGQHFSVNRMLSFESVKLRLERDQSLSFLEFNYMILQGYDFVELFRTYGCTLQTGGSDQWGNIVNGIELGRRMDQTELFGLTTPLIETASGAKMGKTAQGAVWLNADQLSPYDYWQFWRNTDDGDVNRFFKLFTDVPLAEIAELDSADINEAKKRLATEATSMAHGDEAARDAEETARKTFDQGGVGSNLPTTEIPHTELENGVTVVNLLKQTGLAASNGEAKRLIKGGGARVNDKRVADDNAVVTPDDLSAEGIIKLSAGKKRHAIVRPA